MKIPKLMHWVWLGDRPIPECCTRWIESWERLHPGWSFQLWRDADLFPMRNQRVFDSLECLGARSDVFRLEIMLRYGGLYLDVDFEPKRNIEGTLGERTLAIMAGANGFIGNGFIGAVPEHPFLDHLAEVIPGLCARFGETGHGQYRPTFFAWTMCYAAWEPKIELLDNTYFYPASAFSAPPPSRDLVAIHREMRTWHEGAKVFPRAN